MKGERFEISTEGMAQLHRGRAPWLLIKELIANVFDEDARNCIVTIEAAKHAKGVRVTVEDDGPGFKNVEDAWTLMRPTWKRGQPEVRGRFNVGEKEILSIAVEASVETVGYTVTFPREGGRTEAENNRSKGTRISVLTDWDPGIIASTIEMLSRFLPPATCNLTINGTLVLHRDAASSFAATLDTIIQSGPAEPVRMTMRKAHVKLHRVGEGNGYIYEMGIPVQKIDAPYLIDVQQKVPLSQNRDTVPAYYLRYVYAYMLNAVVDELDNDACNAAWVKIAVEDNHCTKETVQKVCEKRFGADAVLWSSNPQVNEAALEAGVPLIHPRTLSKREREVFTSAGALPSASTAFDVPRTVPTVESDAVTDDMRKVSEYARFLARTLLHKDISVQFIQVNNRVLADYGGGTLRFNVRLLGKAWFEGSPDPKHTSLILHELAHDTDSDFSHHGDYVGALADLAAKAVHMNVANGYSAGAALR